MFSASDVKELREKTQAGMLDCKKALDACQGDMDKAIDWLREKGIAKAAKKADRIAAEGLSFIAIEGNNAVILEVNCETDFVSKNDTFKEIVSNLANGLLNSNANTVEEAMEVTIDGTKVSDIIINSTAKIGEKISFRRFTKVTKNDDEVFGDYIHMGGKIAVLTVVNGTDSTVAKDVAMHAAAMRPAYVCPEDVPEDVLNHEKDMMRTELTNEGKPADKIEMILPGKVKKYYEENCLLNQIFVKAENKETVEKFLSNNNSKLVSMTRYEVGEGIEKRVDDFASEVMSQING